MILSFLKVLEACWLPFTSSILFGTKIIPERLLGTRHVDFTYSLVFNFRDIWSYPMKLSFTLIKAPMKEFLRELLADQNTHVM